MGLPDERCAMPVAGPADWARAKFHDGYCKRKAVETLDGQGYCRQHAAAMRRFLAGPQPPERRSDGIPG